MLGFRSVVGVLWNYHCGEKWSLCLGCGASMLLLLHLKTSYCARANEVIIFFSLHFHYTLYQQQTFHEVNKCFI